MPWSRFEPGFTRHPKRLKCGPLASWLWTCSVDHCTEYRTDGFLDRASVPGLVPGLSSAVLKKCVQSLVDVHSWEWDASRGGYLVHGYLEHNLTAQQVESDRESSRRRYRTWKSNAAGRGDANAVANAVSDGATAAQQTLYPNGPRQSVSQSVSQKPPGLDVDVDLAREVSHPGSDRIAHAMGFRTAPEPRAGSGPARIGDLIESTASIALARPPYGRYGEILARIKAEQPEQDPAESERQALDEFDRELKRASR